MLWLAFLLISVAAVCLPLTRASAQTIIAAPVSSASVSPAEGNDAPPAPPRLQAEEASMTIPVGYAAFSTNVFLAVGSPAPTLSAVTDNPKLTWNAENNCIDVAAGLPVGEYYAVITAANGISPDAVCRFTLIVSQAPSISGASELTLASGYLAQSTAPYTITGYPAPVVRKEFGNDAITWNDMAMTVDIAAGLAAGVYRAGFIVYNGNPPEAMLEFTLTVIDVELAVVPSGCIEFQEGRATGVAGFRISATGAPLDAANFGRATLGGHLLDLGSLGTPGADGSVENGSIKLIINRSMLNSLAVGEHILTVTLKGGLFEGMTVSGKVTVTEPPDIPPTGDDAPLPVLLLLSALSFSCAVFLAFSRRRSRA